MRCQRGHVGRALVSTMLVRGAGDFRAALLALATAIRLASKIAEPVFTDLLHAGLSWARPSQVASLICSSSVAAPSQWHVPQYGVDAEDSGLLQDFRVRDSVLPSQFQYSAEAAKMIVIQLPGLVQVDGPGLRCVNECRQDDGLVHLQFGVQVTWRLAI
ncbi:unnamed protein product [Schistocephalus solidus]|uniref:CS domain-containing protein n=1 Tax=Schistocephalus solidus TaxID=70667 RepID=A0A183STA4_SCHSO|nr:unnamed protein product [Schistocephalus solidus]